MRAWQEARGAVRAPGADAMVSHGAGAKPSFPPSESVSYPQLSASDRPVEKEQAELLERQARTLDALQRRLEDLFEELREEQEEVAAPDTVRHVEDFLATARGQGAND